MAMQNVRHIKSLVSNPLSLIQTSETCKSSPTKSVSDRPVVLSKANIASLWISLTSLYSNLFLSKFGAEDTGTWFECLKDLTPRAIDNGIETLRCGGANGKYAQFPPNPVEFRMLCLAYYANLHLPSEAIAYEEITGRAYIP